ncbi:hypothetical protein U5903_04135 [Cereibacter johrii]|uniref:hypothetical protein n=1 Tax=Cereibacter johrii TaxID=445629 RepID=UPI002B259A3B|nr:hypothetical protein [Cereibacter johrii]MEA5159957.1 hypothetical protein [Cereibacter johrii]
MTLLLALLDRVAGPLAVGLSVLALLLYTQGLRRDVQVARADAARAEARAGALSEAAEKVRRQARALEASRAQLAEDRQVEEGRIRAAAGECLDEPLPADLLD